MLFRACLAQQSSSERPGAQAAVSGAAPSLAALGSMAQGPREVPSGSAVQPGLGQLGYVQGDTGHLQDQK